MLVRRLADTPVLELHQLRSKVLMDAGELGSRHMTITWLEVAPGVSESLRSHGEAEQVYVVVSGSGTLSATGSPETLGPGDLALIPPASDHTIANEGDAPLVIVSAQSPAVSADETFSNSLAEDAGYDELDSDY